MDKRKLYIIFTIIIVALLPSAVFASVIIDQSYSVSTSTPSNPILLTQGPNYATANQLGFANLTYKTSTTGNSITFGYVDNDTSVELVNVLEIKNNTRTGDHNHVYIDLSVSSDTSGLIAVYYNSTPVTETFPTTAELGTEVTTSPTTLVIGSNTTSTAPVWYISVVITGTVSNATLTMSYEIQ